MLNDIFLHSQDVRNWKSKTVLQSLKPRFCLVRGHGFQIVWALQRGCCRGLFVCGHCGLVFTRRLAPRSG